MFVHLACQWGRLAPLPTISYDTGFDVCVFVEHFCPVDKFSALKFSGKCSNFVFQNFSKLLQNFGNRSSFISFSIHVKLLINRVGGMWVGGSPLISRYSPPHRKFPSQISPDLWAGSPSRAHWQCLYCDDCNKLNTRQISSGLAIW